MSTSISPTDVLTRCYSAGVSAVEPERALAAALPASGPSHTPVFLIAAGKASLGMSRAMVNWLAAHGRTPAEGVIIGTEDVIPPHAALRSVAGDHPIPGERSGRAADVIGVLISGMPQHAEVHVAISGGASALIAGPLAPLTMRDVTATFTALLASGLDIRDMNAIRKRVTRWSAGRLAKALWPRRVFTWLVSDVPGDDPATIGSGPCCGDPATSAEVRALLVKAGLARRLPAAVSAAIFQETPKPADQAFAEVHLSVIGTNRMALLAARAEALRLGIEACVIDQPLSGEASAMGRSIATGLLGYRGESTLFIRGGETTVTIHGEAGRGGRSQELALAAAKALRGTRSGIVLLAAGTDGRDGPTDAAGAIVDAATWDRIVAAGIDPQAALDGHDAYTALDAAGALLKTGSTGTNVADLVIAIREPSSAS